MQEKLEQRTKHPSSKCREAMEMFGGSVEGGRGIDKARFKLGMDRLGFVLSPAQLSTVFKALDHDGTGYITFADLAAGVLSDEYKVRKAARWGMCPIWMAGWMCVCNGRLAELDGWMDVCVLCGAMDGLVPWRG